MMGDRVSQQTPQSQLLAKLSAAYGSNNAIGSSIALDWPNTWAELPKLKSLLMCNCCHNMVQDPVSLIECEHFFCRDCLEEALEGDSTCPTCSLPCYPKDMRRDEQVWGIVEFASRLSGLLESNDAIVEESQEDDGARQRPTRGSRRRSSSVNTGTLDTTAGDDDDNATSVRRCADVTDKPLQSTTGRRANHRATFASVESVNLLSADDDGHDEDDDGGDEEQNDDEQESTEKQAERVAPPLRPVFEGRAPQKKGTKKQATSSTSPEAHPTKHQLQRTLTSMARARQQQPQSQPPSAVKLPRRSLEGKRAAEAETDTLVTSSSTEPISSTAAPQIADTLIPSPSRKRSKRAPTSSPPPHQQQQREQENEKEEEEASTASPSPHADGEGVEDLLVNEEQLKELNAHVSLSNLVFGRRSRKQRGQGTGEEAHEDSVQARAIARGDTKSKGSSVGRRRKSKMNTATSSHALPLVVAEDAVEVGKSHRRQGETKRDSALHATAMKQRNDRDGTPAKQRRKKKGAVQASETISEAAISLIGDSGPASGERSARRSRRSRRGSARAPAQQQQGQQHPSQSALPMKQARERRKLLEARRRSSAKKSPSRIEKRNPLGETPLHVACKKGNIERVRSLLLQGASANNRDNAGWTPLHEVCQTGNEELVKLLIEHSVDVNAASYTEKETPLHDAVSCPSSRAISVLLVAHGANPLAMNSRGLTPLDICCDDETKDAVRAEHERAKSRQLESGTSSDGHQQQQLLQGTGQHTTDQDANVHPREGNVDAPQEIVHACNQQHPRKDSPLPETSHDAEAVTSSTPHTSTLLESDQMLSCAIQPIIVTTGIPDQLKGKLQKLCRKFGGSIRSSVTDAVTHVVTLTDEKGQVKRTMKYLRAVVRGAYIIDAAWIFASENLSYWANEAAYLVAADTCAKDGARKARVSREQQEPGLFSGCSVFFAKGDNATKAPTYSFLKELIVAADGKVLSREPLPDSGCSGAQDGILALTTGTSRRHRRSGGVNDDEDVRPYHCPPGKDARFVVVTSTDRDFQRFQRKFRGTHVRCVQKDWVLDCISRYELF